MTVNFYPRVRWALFIVAFLIILHSALSYTHPPYAQYFGQGRTKYPPTVHQIPETYYASPEDLGHANATLLMLARNSDADGAVAAVKDIELKFNQNRGYPWVFLNDEPFTDEFKRRVSVLIRSKVEFGQVPKEHWAQPDWIDEEKATAEREKMVEENVIYGGSVSYRNMCRFNSGFFFHHPLLQKYRWYWRVEPDVSFSCYMDFDPFIFMARSNKTYGFTITMYEYPRTIESLWGHVKDFSKSHPEYIAPNNALKFISHDSGESYNYCHFWSNFEIADMNLWRSQAYTDFFNYLDSKGGFYYERWGDAPVHSIAAAMFLRRDQIHFFNEIGYQHSPYNHCPQGNSWERGKCWCGQDMSFDYDIVSCLKKWEGLVGKTV